MNEHTDRKHRENEPDANRDPISGAPGSHPVGTGLGAAAGGAQNVHLTGARADASSFIASADVVVSTSRTEGAPAVLIEAMLAGVPVAAFEVGGIPGVVPSAAGVLVPAGDETALADALRDLLADPERRERLGDAGREASAPFRMEVVAKAFDDLYRELIA